MKKPVLLILVASFALLVVLGVAVVSAQDEPVTLVFWSMWNETEGQALVIQDAIAKYEEQNPNVTINSVWNGRQNQTLVRTALSGGTTIDLVDQDEDQIAGGLMREGFGLALNDYLAQPALDHEEPLSDVFLPGTLDMFSDEGNIYLIPIGIKLRRFRPEPLTPVPSPKQVGRGEKNGFVFASTLTSEKFGEMVVRAGA